MIDAPSIRMNAIAIDDSSAVRNVCVVVVDDAPVVVPIESPIVPTPAESAKKSNPEAQPKTDSRAVQEKSRIRIPAWEDSHRRPIHQPRIVLRYVNHVGRFRL